MLNVTAALLIVALSLQVDLEGAKFREWKSTGGTSIEARLLSVKDGSKRRQWRRSDQPEARPVGDV